MLCFLILSVAAVYNQLQPKIQTILDMPENYTLTLLLTPKSISTVNTTKNILHISLDGQNQNNGSSIPAIYFEPKSTRLAIKIDLTNFINFSIPGLPSLPVDIQSNITIVGYGRSLEVYVNNITHVSWSFYTPRVFGNNATLYLSDFFHDAADVTLQYLSIKNVTQKPAATILPPPNTNITQAMSPYHVKLLQGGMYVINNTFHHYGVVMCTPCKGKVYVSTSTDALKTWTQMSVLADLAVLANRAQTSPFGVSTTGGCPRDNVYAQVGGTFTDIERPKVLRVLNKTIIWAKLIAFSSSAGRIGNGHVIVSHVVGTNNITCVLPQNVGGDLNVEYMNSTEAYFILSTYSHAVNNATLNTTQDFGEYPYGMMTLWRVSADGSNLVDWKKPIGVFGNVNNGRFEAPDLRYDFNNQVWIFTASQASSWKASLNIVATGARAVDAMLNFHGQVMSGNLSNVNEDPGSVYGGNNGSVNFNAKTVYLFVHENFYMYMADVYCPGWNATYNAAVNYDFAHQRWALGSGGLQHKVQSPREWKVNF